MIYTKVIEMLEQSHRAFRIHKHPPVTTIEEAQQKVPHLTRNLLKTIVFRIKNSDWVLAAVKGSSRIHYKKLGDAMGVNRKILRSIAPDQVASELGFEIGGVGPFPVRPDIRVVFDATVAQLDDIFCGSGRNTLTVEMRAADLISITGGCVYPICK